MAFFKDLFARKKGGTFTGNLVRKYSNELTGGAIGNGKNLNKWENSKGYNPTQFEIGLPIISKKSHPSKPVTTHTKHPDIVEQVTSLGKKHNKALNESPDVKEAKKQLTISYLKKNWLTIGGVVALLIFIGSMLTRKKKKVRVKRR